MSNAGGELSGHMRTGGSFERERVTANVSYKSSEQSERRKGFKKRHARI